MDSVSPVFTQAEVDKEQVIALDQPEYQPIVILPLSFQRGEVVFKNFAISTRFRLSPEERQALIDGADLVVTELVFGNAFTPLNMQICKPEEAPEFNFR